jgi:hypothetical protein
MVDCDVCVCVCLSVGSCRMLLHKEGGLIAATILFLSLAWSGIDPQGAEAVYDIPYQVTIFLQILFGRAICLHLYQQFNDV